MIPEHEISNVPWAVGTHHLEQLEASIDAGVFQSSQLAASSVTRKDGWVVISIHGPLMRRGKWLVSYETLRGQLQSAFNSNAKGILLDIDSYGGATTGLYELVDYILAMKAKTGKPVVAVANHYAMSAAYAIATAADRIYVTPTAGVGSVGVIALHTDQSGKHRKQGLKITPLYAGGHKIDGASFRPLHPSARIDIQESVNSLYGMLVKLVANNRGMSEQSIRNTEAATYSGKKAVEIGLADGVVQDIEQALEMCSQRPPKRRPVKRTLTSGRTQSKETLMNSQQQQIDQSWSDIIQQQFGSSPIEATEETDEQETSVIAQQGHSSSQTEIDKSWQSVITEKFRGQNHETV